MKLKRSLYKIQLGHTCSQCLRNMKNVYTGTMLSHNILELINHNTNIYLKCSIFNRIENSNPKFKLNSGKI